MHRFFLTFLVTGLLAAGPLAVTPLFMAAAGVPAAHAADSNTPDGIVTPAKDTWPKKAECAVCVAKGGGHGEEKVAGASTFRGVTYYFCNDGCKKEFDADPVGFLPPEFPRPAPAFTVPDAAGKPVSLADYKGRIVLVDFWATWCQPCLAVIPDLEKLSARYADKGFTVLGVAIDEKQKTAEDYVKKKKVSYPMAYDVGESQAWELFGVKAIPATFLVDRDGQIVAQWTGAPDIKEMEKAIEGLMGAEEKK